MTKSPEGIPGDGSFVEWQAEDVRRLVLTSLAQPPPRTDQQATDAALPGKRLVVPPFRIVVATDFASESFSAATVPLAVLRAFAQMFAEGAPVNLVFAVGHQAGDADVSGARRLLGQLTTTRSLAGVSIESFDEVQAQPTYVAVIPTGDPYTLVDELAAAITGMHLLAETIANPGRLRIALVHQHLIARRRDATIGHRLAAYREVELPRA